MAGIAEKFTSLLARPSDETAPPDGAPWYLKYGVRVLGIVAAFFAMLFGLWNCLSIIFFSVGCLVSGVLQIFAGFIVMAVEAPFCCMFLEHAQVIARKADERPMWNRAALYCIIAIPPVIFCPGLGSIFGCGLIFATGVVYGMMSIGKKGTREDMAAVASPTGTGMQPGMEGMQGMPGQPMQTTDQHVTLMEDPDSFIGGDA
ncbi:calcium channel flower isoform X1 [Condylostylus longicornis]|uniref:calcium channel flower isoform X1 n=1 Tax=Condylostylus longicornis TaxID=2530218 RepID=UPI00244DD22C|nr:calcium channel flower isoform X1 [Condylostylus longicornis]